MNDSFFDRSGTLRDLVGFSQAVQNNPITKDVKGLRSDSSMDRLGSLVKIVGSIIAMCA